MASNKSHYNKKKLFPESRPTMNLLLYYSFLRVAFLRLFTIMCFKNTIVLAKRSVYQITDTLWGFPVLFLKSFKIFFPFKR